MSRVKNYTKYLCSISRAHLLLYPLKRGEWGYKLIEICTTTMESPHRRHTVATPLRCSCWRHETDTFSALLGLCAGNSPVNGEFPSPPLKGQSRGASMFYAWTNGWVNNRDAGDLRRNRAHYDVIVMCHWNHRRQSKQLPLKWKGRHSDYLVVNGRQKGCLITMTS